jgi:hypothetical protein
MDHMRRILQWLKDFTAIIKLSKHKKVLIVLHGKSTHTKKKVEATDLSGINGILLLSVPVHNTPLDFSFFTLLSTYFHQVCDK